ncbi:hypothetical protein D9M72_452950 [compost metagenome]
MDRREDDVVTRGPTLDLRQHLLVRGIGGEVDLDLGLFLELLEDSRIDVFAPVVDVELSRLRRAEQSGKCRQ